MLINGSPLGSVATVAPANLSPEQRWQNIVQKLAQLDANETQSALLMGDLLLEVVDKYGDSALISAIQESGVSLSVAKQRSWVAKKLGPNSLARRSSLSFSLLRLLAGTEDPDQWTQKVVQNNWNATQLQDALQDGKNKAAIAAGAKCSVCGTPLSAAEKVVQLKMLGQRSLYGCTRACVEDILDQLEFDVEGAPIAQESSGEPLVPPPAPPPQNPALPASRLTISEEEDEDSNDDDEDPYADDDEEEWVELD